ncbi:hypothetical protein EBU95_08830 [bacterium]|nr:hypothetical protein [bacterium]
MEDAEAKLVHLLNNPRTNLGKMSDWTNGTIDRCIDIMDNRMNEQWYRGNNRYRNYVPESKF